MFTSLGLLSAFMAMVSIDREDWRACFLWLFLCFIIDAIDGTLARIFKVKEVLPHVDGKSIDYVIDFATYAIIPAFFFYKTEMVNTVLMPLAIIVILVSSALYYGKTRMVEDDQYFIGFPVLWNFVIFYQFFVLQNNQLLNIISVLIFGILHFVPLKFAYPSKAKRYFGMHLFFSITGLTSVLAILFIHPESNFYFEIAAMSAIAYFGLFAVYDTLF